VLKIFAQIVQRIGSSGQSRVSMALDALVLSSTIMPAPSRSSPRQQLGLASNAGGAFEVGAVWQRLFQI